MSKLGGNVFYRGVKPSLAPTWIQISGCYNTGMKLSSLFALVVLIAIPFGDVAAQTYEEAEAAYKKGDYKTARRIALPLAKSGNPSAQHLLSVVYSLGQGVETDVCESTMWADKAARQNLGRAQYSLALAYYHGNGVYRNSALTYRWALAAIRSGYKRAALRLKYFASELEETKRLQIRKSMAAWRAEDQPPAQIVRLPNTLAGRITGHIRGVWPCRYDP